MSGPPAQPTGRPLSILPAAVILTAFVCMAVADIVSTSPTYDETVHLAAGFSYLTSNDYRLNTEHPPLLKKLAALPLRLMDVWPARRGAEGKITLQRLGTEWTAATNNAQAEWFFAHDFFYGLRDQAYARLGRTPRTLPTEEPLSPSDFLNDSHSMFVRARLVLLFFGVALGALLFAWSARLWGTAGGLLSLLLFAFDPNFIAHSGLVTTDVGVTALMTAAVAFLWWWSKEKRWFHAAAFVIFFALAQAAKFSAILLVPIVLVALFIIDGSRRAKIALFAGALIAAWAMIWASYGFRYSASASPNESLPLGGLVQVWEARSAAAERGLPPGDEVLARFATQEPRTLSGRAVVAAARFHLLPEAYLFGLAFQQSNGVARPSFLNGEATTEPLHGYFFWTFLFKTPPVMIAAILLGAFFAFRRRESWRDVALLAAPVLIYGGVSAVYALSVGHRHLLPLYPFLYVLAGASAAAWRRLAPALRTATASAAILLIAFSGLFVLAPPASLWGSHLSYMNELAGGPENGWRRLSDSNFDWGQDLPSLAAWLRENGVKEPVTLIYFGTADPRAYGIHFVNPPGGYFLAPPSRAPSGRLVAVSVSAAASPSSSPASKIARDLVWSGTHQPVAKAGKTIFIYRMK